MASTLEKASLLLEEFKAANVRNPVSKVNRDVIWTPPPSGYIKLNTDGGWAVGSGTRGIGGVVRDEHGLLVGAFAKPIHAFISPLATELLALRVGLDFVKCLGNAPVLVETDSIEAARLVNDSEECWNENENLVADIKETMHTIHNVKVSYVPREINNVAHRLATASANDALQLNCNNIGPSWLLELISLDSSPCNPS